MVVLTGKEIVAATGAATGVVTLSVVATLQLSGEGGAGGEAADRVIDPSRYAYQMSDAIFSCRDEIGKSIPYKVRNINVDSHSSRYEELENTNLVFMELEVLEKPGSFYSKYSYDARIVCGVSAASNEVTRFKVIKS